MTRSKAVILGTDAAKDLVNLFERSERRAIVLSILLPILASVLLYSNDYRQHQRVARYFTEIVRYEIVTGSIRDAAFQAQRMVMRNGPFFRIQYVNFNGEKLIDQISSDNMPLMSNSIHQSLRFDESADSKVVGQLTYFYSLDTFLGLSVLIFCASAFSVMGYLVRHRRITAWKIEEEMSRQRNEAIAKTINGIAHDLRAPLNMIEIFLSHIEGKTVKDYKAARQGLLRIYAMIESLRFSDVDQIVKPSLAALDTEYMSQLLKSIAHQKGKNLKVQGLQEFVLPIDHPKIERVIQNLVVNAIESAKQEVALKFTECDGILQIIVEDDGDGVPDAIAGRLFQRGTTFGKQGGTGLGLSYCKSVVEGHGGTVSYCRDQGITKFKVELPIGPGHILENSSDQSARLSPKGVTVGCFLTDKGRQREILELLKTNFSEIQIGTSSEFVEKADIVFVDSLDTMSELPNPNLVFVKKQDSNVLLIGKLKNILSRLESGK